MPIKNIGYPNKDDKIIISDESVGKPRKIVGYICPNCRCRMGKIAGTTDEWACSHCQHVEYIEEESVNVAQTAEIPKPQTLDNSEVFVNTTTMPSSIFDKQPPKYEGGFAALAQKGIRITSYHEYLPGGGQSQNYNQGSSSTSWSNEGKVKRVPTPTRMNKGDDDTMNKGDDDTTE